MNARWDPAGQGFKPSKHQAGYGLTSVQFPIDSFDAPPPPEAGLRREESVFALVVLGHPRSPMTHVEDRL